MDKEMLSKQIGQRLKRIRLGRELTLEQVSKATGVSKPMLGQIERGESNPTVSTLWKIAKGLHVSFSSFIDEEEAEVTVVKRGALQPLQEGEGVKVFPLFPRKQDKPMEVFSVILSPNKTHQSDGHSPGVEEYVFVERGRLTLHIGTKEFTIEQGEGIHFHANQLHSYQNVDRVEDCIFTNIIYYDINWGVGR